MDDLVVVLHRYKKNKDKLRRNITQMTDEQKMAYHAPLQKLKSKVNDDLQQVANTMILSPFRILDADAGSDAERQFVEEAVRIINENAKFIRDAIYEHADTNDIFELYEDLLPIRTLVNRKAYIPYFMSRTKVTDDPDFPVYSEILNMWWWDEAEEWTCTKIENGKRVVDYHGGITLFPDISEVMRNAGKV